MALVIRKATDWTTSTTVLAVGHRTWPATYEADRRSRLRRGGPGQVVVGRGHRPGDPPGAADGRGARRRGRRHGHVGREEDTSSCGASTSCPSTTGRASGPRCWPAVRRRRPTSRYAEIPLSYIEGNTAGRALLPGPRVHRDPPRERVAGGAGPGLDVAASRAGPGRADRADRSRRPRRPTPRSAVMTVVRTGPARGREHLDLRSGCARSRRRSSPAPPSTTSSPSLDRIAAVMELLGDPQRTYPVIHLTGTNGKTSTTRMIDSLLREMGLRTGRFTSPHLHDIRERIAFAGEPISRREVPRGLRRRAAVHRDRRRPLGRRGRPADDLLRGARRHGVRRVRRRARRRRRRRGRAWAAAGTRPTSPTARSPSSRPIALDHEQFLGDDVEDIATEKRGIIKADAVAVIGRPGAGGRRRSCSSAAAEVGATDRLRGQRLRRPHPRGRRRWSADRHPRAGAATTRTCSCRCTARTRPTTRPRRSRRSRRSSAAASSGSTPTSCAPASPASPRPGGWRSSAARRPSSSTPRTTRPGRWPCGTRSRTRSPSPGSSASSRSSRTRTPPRCSRSSSPCSTRSSSSARPRRAPCARRPGRARGRDLRRGPGAPSSQDLPDALDAAAGPGRRGRDGRGRARHRVGHHRRRGPDAARGGGAVKYVVLLLGRGHACSCWSPASARRWLGRGGAVLGPASGSRASSPRAGRRTPWPWLPARRPVRASAHGAGGRRAAGRPSGADAIRHGSSTRARQAVA